MEMTGFKRGRSPVQIIALGFLVTILIGSLLLSLPFCIREGVDIEYVDSLYISTSAVCVTGLVTRDIADTFTPVGQAVILLLIQIGGLGVSSMSAAVILLLGKKMDLKERNLIKASMNLDTGKGIVIFVKNVFFTTVVIELAGAIFSFFVFIKDFPFLKALWMSLFHSVAAFNNSGFDLLGSFKSLTEYENNAPLLIITAVLIFLGGIGFLVIREVIAKKFRWKKLSMHSKVVISMSIVLIVAGTVLLMITEEVSLLGAFFLSVSTRTAGFSNYDISTFKTSGMLVIIALMFIGASPGSTGGGVKTSTIFVLFQNIKAAAINKSEKAFHYSIPRDAFKKSAVVVILGIMVVFGATFAASIFEPTVALRDILFEMTSAFGTVGLSTGITPTLSLGSKILSMIVMYIGRLGPLTIANLWYFSKGESFRYPEGNISVG